MPWRSARARAHVQPDDLGFACLWSTLLRHSWQNTLMISLPCLGFLLLCLCFSAVPDMFGFLFNSYCIDPKCIGAWIFRTIVCNTFSTNFHRWAWHFDIPLVVFFFHSISLPLDDEACWSFIFFTFWFSTNCQNLCSLVLRSILHSN